MLLLLQFVLSGSAQVGFVQYATSAPSATPADSQPKLWIDTNAGATYIYANNWILIHVIDSDEFGPLSSGNSVTLSRPYFPSPSFRVLRNGVEQSAGRDYNRFNNTLTFNRPFTYDEFVIVIY